jgi:hypothetical protein
VDYYDAIPDEVRLTHPLEVNQIVIPYEDPNQYYFIYCERPKGYLSYGVKVKTGVDNGSIGLEVEEQLFLTEHSTNGRTRTSSGGTTYKAMGYYGPVGVELAYDGEVSARAALKDPTGTFKVSTGGSDLDIEAEAGMGQYVFSANVGVTYGGYVTVQADKRDFYIQTNGPSQYEHELENDNVDDFTYMGYVQIKPDGNATYFPPTHSPEFTEDDKNATINWLNEPVRTRDYYGGGAYIERYISVEEKLERREVPE